MTQMNPIPQFNGYGILPAGVHDCSWHQFRARFAYNPHRREILRSLVSFLRKEVIPAGISAPIYLDGSYARNKPMPADVDVVLDLRASPPQAAIAGLMLFQQRVRIKQQYKVDFWVKHPVMECDLSAFFQYLGDKAGAELSLDKKWPKGILRITP